MQKLNYSKHIHRICTNVVSIHTYIHICVCVLEIKSNRDTDLINLLDWHDLKTTKKKKNIYTHLYKDKVKIITDISIHNNFH